VRGRLLGYSGEFINVSENLTSHELAFEGKLAQNHPTIIIPTNKKGMVIYIYIYIIALICHHFYFFT